jgi:hypothetical protein
MLPNEDINEDVRCSIAHLSCLLGGKSELNRLQGMYRDERIYQKMCDNIILAIETTEVDYSDSDSDSD